MAKPGTQFTIRKEIYNRVRKAFDENGIEFARKEVQVNILGILQTQPLTPDQQQAASAAASVAAERVATEPAPAGAAARG